MTRRSVWLLSFFLVSAACSKKENPGEAAAKTTAIAAHDPGGAPEGPVEKEVPKPPETKSALQASIEKKLNVILITVDSLRADMPWTGYPRPIAPFLTELSKESVAYTHAYSVSSTTSKSVSALFTGRYPSALYRSGSFFTAFSDANLFFTEMLQKQGIRTLGWHGHMYFGRDKGLGQGFDRWELVPGITFNSETDEHVTSDKMTDLGIQLLSDPKNTEGQFFAWAHYMDPHDQYIRHRESPDFGKNNRDRYDSEVFFTDLHLKRLFDFAKTKPWFERTVVIVSADHGEAFGEHGMYKHAFELWEVLCRVPLLIKIPGVSPKQIQARRSGIDLAPTILELMGVKVPEAMHGQSLLPDFEGKEPAAPRPFILLDLPEDSHNPPRRAILQGSHKLYVQDDRPRFMLFNLDEDPGESTDLADSDPETLKRMKALLEETHRSLPAIEPYGGMKLRTGRRAKGPREPAQ